MSDIKKKAGSQANASADRKKLFFQWHDQMSVSIRKIDAQHRTLIVFINDAYKALQDPKGNEIMRQVLHDLFDYAKIHFAYEEKLLNQYGYILAEAHSKEHRKFEFQILQFYKEYDSNPAAVGAKICAFLKEWLLTHIMVNDQAYASHLHRNGVS